MLDESEASFDRPVQLESGERLLLWGFRTMTQHHRCGCPAVATMQQVYGQYFVEDAVASLEMLVEAFATTAHTAIVIHGPCCPCVSESEARLLQAVASAQSADLHAARRQFEHWLPELAADWILGAACGVGRVFEAAGMTLPMRGSGTIDMDTDSAAASWSIGSNARH